MALWAQPDQVDRLSLRQAVACVRPAAVAGHMREDWNGMRGQSGKADAEIEA